MLPLIREKIIKTDEVLKLLLEKNVELEKLRGKYQTLVYKYVEQSKQYKKLKQDCDAVCISNDEQQTKITKLEEELSACKTEYGKLQSVHVEYINSAHLQYQSVNQALIESQNKLQEYEQQIKSTGAGKDKKQCYNCGKLVKKRKLQKDDSDSTCEELPKRQRQNSYAENHLEFTEQDGMLLDAKTEISSLQNKVSLFSLDNTNLRNELQKIQENNTTLKQNVKEEKRKSDKLQEKVDALLLEVEILKFNQTEKCGTHDFGVQTEITDEKDDEINNISSFCEELIRLPRLLSPLEEDMLHDEGISTNGLNSPCAVSFIEDEIYDGSTESEILNTSIHSIRSERLLDVVQKSSNCCTAYTVSVRDDDSGESCLLGFASTQEEECCNKEIVLPIKARKNRKSLMKRCSDEIYTRVMKNVLKYINLRKLNSHKKKNVKMFRKKRKTVQTKKIVKDLCENSSQIESADKNNIATDEEGVLHNSYFCYDTSPDSVDSGYSAQTSTESECSEILSCKFSGSNLELNTLSTEDCDRTKLELFGSDSDSEHESSHSSNLKCDNKITQPLVQNHNDNGKRRTSRNNNKTENIQIVGVTKRSCKKQVLTSFNCKRTTEDNPKNEQLPDKVIPSNTNHFTKDDTKESDKFRLPTLASVKIKPQPQIDYEKKVFKRPNCRRRILESPQSPEPEPSDEKLSHKPIIIPLNKPKQMKVITIHKIFEKLLTYPEEPQILEEVADKLSSQEAIWIAKAIVSMVSSDYHSKVESKDNPFAPLLTQTQKVLLGLMIKLENKNMSNIIPSFEVECEKHILHEKSIEHLVPVTRLYLAVCKMKSDVYRMRKTCLDAAYFMGDLVIPFLYTVLSSWAEVLPTQSTGSILAKVLVQVINLKTCNFPGYNLLNLRTIISRLHGYPSERWNSDDLFAEIVSVFKENPNRQDTVVAFLVFCKNHSASWVTEKLEKLTESVISMEDSLLQEKTLNILCQVMKQFDVTVDQACIKKVEIFQSRLTSN